jgi:tetratricopeptide (TPR) repeat protein
MTTRDGVQDSRDGPAGRQPHDKAYFLNLLGDSHTGLGRHEAAIDAYRQAAEAFKSQGAHCSYALCLWKVAEGHLSLGEPWHALGYLQASLPLLHELGLTRHEALAREQLAQCQTELAGALLRTEGERSETVSPENRDKGRFLLCPGPTDRRAG